jgi:hypothetical protein
MRTIKPITDEMVAALRAEPVGVIEAIAGQQGNCGSRYVEIPIRILKRITVDYETGCWRVSGWNTGNGFANIKLNGRTLKVHRVTFRLLRGPIPDDKLLDHDKKTGCKYRDCGNPWHLEPVTVKENTDRGEAKLFVLKEGRL